MLHRNGEPLAFVGATRYYLAPHIGRLPPDDKERRAIEGICIALLQRRQYGPFYVPRPLI